MFAVAKEIMDVSLGPGHVDTIEACQNLSKAYGSMGSYPLAIKFQEQVIDAWEGHSSSAQDELKEAHRLLEQLKKKARAVSSNEPLVKALALPLPNNSEFVSTRSSQPGVSISFLVQYSICMKLLQNQDQCCTFLSETPISQPQHPRGPTNHPLRCPQDRKIKERSQLEEAFESAKTSEDMHRAFKDMEASFDESSLALACLKLGLKLDQEDMETLCIWRAEENCLWEDGHFNGVM